MYESANDLLGGAPPQKTGQVYKEQYKVYYGIIARFFSDSSIVVSFHLKYNNYD